MKARGGGSRSINTASIAGLQAGWGPIDLFHRASAAVIHLSTRDRLGGAFAARTSASTPSALALIATLHLRRVAWACPVMVADQMVARIAEVAPKFQPVPKGGAAERHRRGRAVI